MWEGWVKKIKKWAKKSLPMQNWEKAFTKATLKFTSAMQKGV